MSIPHLDPSANRETILEELESKGCVVIDNLIDKSTVEQIKSDMVPHLTPTPVKDEFAGRHTKRAGLLISRSPEGRELVMHPKLLEITEKI